MSRPSYVSWVCELSILQDPDSTSHVCLETKKLSTNYKSTKATFSEVTEHKRADLSSAAVGVDQGSDDD